MLAEGISCILLAYKEEENLRVLLPQIISQLDDTHEKYEILVIDTAQPTDNTEQVCGELGARYINQRYPAFGGAFSTGIEEAKYDKFLILDSDGSHPPRYIADIYELYTSGDYDVVIGSRYTKGGITHDSASSIAMSKLLNTVFRVSLGLRAKDISTDYRMYNTEQLKAIHLTHKNYDVLQEVLVKLTMNKGGDLNIAEVPIEFKKRVYGESKRKLIPFIIEYGKSVFSLSSIRYPLLRNIVLYGLFGIMAAFVEYIVFALLTYTGLKVEMANIIGALCGFAFSFTTNTVLNFKKIDNILRRLLSYGIIVIIGICISTSAISILKDYMNVYVLKLILLVVVSAGQFVANRKITYR